MCLQMISGGNFLKPQLTPGAEIARRTSASFVLQGCPDTFSIANERWEVELDQKKQTKARKTGATKKLRFYEKGTDDVTL